MDPTVAEVCDRCVQNVCRRVDASLTGILDYTDDESDTDYLHGDVVRDTEQTTCQRDQKQGTACNTGSSGCWLLPVRT